jgi:type I restriction enzyme, S subunit
MSDLPEGWEWVTAGSVAEVQGGIQKQPKRRPIANRYPFLRVANVPRGRLDLSDIHEVELFNGEIERYRLQSGDLLVVEGNGSPDQIGRAAQWLGEIENCVHQNHLIRVRPTAAIDPRYLSYYWNASQTTNYLRSVASSTSGLYVLTASKVRSVRIPLPPLGEQLRIVAAIEEQFSRLDAGGGGDSGVAIQPE